MARELTLGQVVGNLKQAREASNRAGAALRNGLKDEHVTGLNRTFIADSEELALQNQNQDEYKSVAMTVLGSLAEDAKITANALDWALTQDVANCSAKADVVVNGTVLLEQVPISHLLHLEKVLSEYKKVVLARLPILDPTKDFGEARDPVSGLWRSRTEEVPVFITRNEPVTLHPGTDRHPPQAVLDQRRSRIGKREVTITSGAVTENEKRALLARMDTLIAAVKEAVAAANHTPAKKLTEGDKIFGYLLGIS